MADDIHILRLSNNEANINYPSDEYLSHLDSSIKKNSAFVKKLKGPVQKATILDELDKLNLTKFVSEVSASIIETKCKLNEVPIFLEICTRLHHRYPEFNKQLLDQYNRYFPNLTHKRKTNEHGLANQYLNRLSTSNTLIRNVSRPLQATKDLNRSPTQIEPTKLRVDLKLFCDLINIGILDIENSLPILSNLLSYLCFQEKDYLKYGNVILTFCKETSKIDIIPQHFRSIYLDEVRRYYKLLIASFKNELPDDVKTRHLVEQLSDLIGVTKPDLLEPSCSSLDLNSISTNITTHSQSESTLKDTDDSLQFSGSATSLNIDLTVTTSSKIRNPPDSFFDKLSDCVDRETIDELAVTFICEYNTKVGRRKLTKALFKVKRTRLDLLPLYSRLAATLHSQIPCVGNELVSLLKNEFKKLFKKKDQINIESKVKNVRFIGELVKHNLYSKQDALNCLNTLLSDFTHHHIEMCCNLLETCGLMLYKNPETHAQLNQILDHVMRKKLLLSVDSKYITMIENAYYATKPPKSTTHIDEEPEIRSCIRQLLNDILSRSTINQVAKQIIALDLNHQEVKENVISCLIEAYQIKFYNIRHLAELVACLKKSSPSIAVTIVEGVVEDILSMIEINDFSFNQRRIPMIRYFGELYNYKLANSSLVFKILYSLVTYGVHYPDVDQSLSDIQLSALDPPNNLFRIKLIADLLDTCGLYLNTGPNRQKLTCYLLFFQRYFWNKRYIYTLNPFCMSQSCNQFPPLIENLFHDTITKLTKPKQFKLATSYEEATSLVFKFMNEQQYQTAQVAKQQTKSKIPNSSTRKDNDAHKGKSNMIKVNPIKRSNNSRKSDKIRDGQYSNKKASSASKCRNTTTISKGD